MGTTRYGGVMCGRFTRSSPPTAIAEEFGVGFDPALVAKPRFNVCPSEPVLVVARGSAAPIETTDDGPASREHRSAFGDASLVAPPATPALAVGLMRWGLVPWFARDPKSGPRSINARAETVATNRTFREAFQRRRCLIVADGFYEWRQVGGERLPYFIRLRSRRPFAFAGVWERWKPPDGELLVSCAIVTCAANAVVAPIHDRMPVIVPAPARQLWLARATAAADLEDLLCPFAADQMEAYPVSKLVNAPRNDEPACIQRIEPPRNGAKVRLTAPNG
jgi:putative SOS response-associated peptidase YedK